LPLQRRAPGLYGPIGGPLNDIHGLIAPAGSAFSAADLLAEAGIGMLSLRHAHIGAGALGARFGSTHAFHVMGLAGGYAAYEERRLPFAKSAFRAIRTRSDKARKEHGELTHIFDDRSDQTLETLLNWKRAQFAATAQPQLFDFAWVRELTDRLHTARDPELRGQLSSLYFGDTLVAAHFGLRTREVLHYWFPGYDPAFAELSPGNILLRHMAESAAEDGVQALHLGAGDYRYKLEFADRSVPVTDGVAFARSRLGRTAAAAGQAVAQLTRKLPETLSPLPGRALRRLDWHLAFRAA
jgi:CelD/BcsL family acetyltransferase involved in cellulose biosynthesis